MSRSKAQAFIMLGGTQFLIGLNVALMKQVAPLMPIYVNLFIRFSVTTILLGFLFYLEGFKAVVPGHDLQNPGLHRREWVLLAMMAAFGGILFNAFMMAGITLTAATSAGVIGATLPAVIAIASFFILGERIDRMRWLCIGMCIAGVLIINMKPQGRMSAVEHSLLGDLLVFLAIIPEAIYTVFGKLLGDRIKPIAVAFYVNAANVIYFIPPALIQLLSSPMEIQWVQGMELSLVMGLIGAQFYYFWQRGLGEVSANIAGLFTGMFPVGAMVAAVLWLDESFGMLEAAGLSCVLLGILIGSGLIKERKLVKLEKDADLAPTNPRSAGAEGS